MLYSCALILESLEDGVEHIFSVNNTPFKLQATKHFPAWYLVGSHNSAAFTIKSSDLCFNVTINDEYLKGKIFASRVETIGNHRVTVILSKQEANAPTRSFIGKSRIGHRGCGVDRPGQAFLENTIASFLEAQAKGADAVEFDVQITADDQVVVFHDCEISGKPINKMTGEEFFKATRNNNSPALIDVLKNTPDDLGLNIELKCPGPCDGVMVDTEYPMRLVGAVLEIVAQYPNKQVMFSSFSFLTCMLLRMAFAQAEVCFLIGSDILSRAEDQCARQFIIGAVEKLQLEGIVIDSEILCYSGDFVKQINELGMRVYTYGEFDNVLSFDSLASHITGCIVDDLSCFEK